MEKDKIIIKKFWSPTTTSNKSKTLVKERCPLKAMNFQEGNETGGADRCSVHNIKCSYAVTEVSVPKNCPLRNGAIQIITSVELSVIKR